MIIQHNIMAMNAHRSLGGNNSMVSKNLEKLSSGFRINRAGDDAAGLAISEKMRSQIKGLEQAQRNSQDGVSLVQTAEGALTEVHSMLNRMVELATQSANGIYTDADRDELQKEISSLSSEIDRIADGTNFNGINLLDGSIKATKTDGAYTATMAAKTAGSASKTATYTLTIAGKTTTKEGKAIFTVMGKDFEISVNTASKASVVATALAAKIGSKFGEYTVSVANNVITFTAAAKGVQNAEEKAKMTASAMAGNAKKNEAGTTIQVGDTADTFNTVRASVDDMHVKELGISDIDISTAVGGRAAIQKINTAIQRVSKARSDLGATQNRLEHTINNLGVTSENLTASESRIRDVDMAKEMMAFTKNNVLTQAAQSMLAQANQQPQQILQLLR